MGLRDTWESEAANWVAWARTPGHDSYWTFHRDAFLELLPAPRGVTLDIGCGEGRLPRDLKARGYEVIGVDASPTLIRHAQDADPDGDYRIADAAALPVADGSMSLVTAFMSLHDVDDLDPAVREIARVMRPDATFAAAIVHPMNSAGTFESREADAVSEWRRTWMSGPTPTPSSATASV
jgi:SAM-dependent methyltransferase